jgi:iron transport multicopper oxidase
LTYSFVADTAGTYWYHSHNMGQYPDGLRGPLIIHDPKAPYAGKVAAEYNLILSDWYHKQTVDIIRAFQSPPTGPPSTPTPDSIIMNDGQSTNFAVQPGKTYLFRIYNVGAFPSFFVNFQGLSMTVVGIDGVFTKSTPANTLYVGAAQRYEVLVTAKTGATTNSAILAMVDTSMFESAYSGPTTILGSLVYPGSLPAPPAYQGLPDSIMPPTDDLTMKPLDGQKLLAPVTKQIVLNFNLGLVSGIPRSVPLGFKSQPYTHDLIELLSMVSLTFPKRSPVSSQRCGHPRASNSTRVSMESIRILSRSSSATWLRLSSTT